MAARRRNLPQIVEFNKTLRNAERAEAQRRFPNLTPNYALRRYRGETRHKTVQEARGHSQAAVRTRYRKTVPVFYSKIVRNKADTSFFRFEHRFRIAAAELAVNMEQALTSHSRVQQRYFQNLAIAVTIDLDLPDDIEIDMKWFFYHGD